MALTLAAVQQAFFERRWECCYYRELALIAVGKWFNITVVCFLL